MSKKDDDFAAVGVSEGTDYLPSLYVDYFLVNFFELSAVFVE